MTRASLQLDKSEKDEYGLYQVKAIAVQQENERKIYEAMNKASVDILQQGRRRSALCFQF